MNKKPTEDEIKDQFEKCKTTYSPVQVKWKEDEEFYELAFKDKLNIPVQQKADRVVLPTARDVVDVAVNHTDINNARVFVNKKGVSDTSDESAEMLRKLGLGVIHRTNVESRIAPGHVGAKHYWIYGLAVFKTVWDADRWPDKPPQEQGESEEDYAKRLDKWRAESHLSIPIIIQAINPACIMPDPYYGGDLYVFEWHKKLVFDVKRTLPNWQNPRKIPSDEEVETISYWDGTYRCELVDGEPILKAGGVVKHKYGFIPYTLIESGLGNLAQDAKPEKRYVGLLRHINDLLVSESTNYTLNDILMKWETLLGGYITGADAGTIGEVKQEYGKWWPVGDKDVEFHKWPRELAPDAAYRHLGLTHDYIAGHAAPRSVRGLSEAGVRSGADRRLVMAEAAAIYRYATPAFANGWAKILTKCALLVKNVIPGDVEIWTRTPTDEFDIPIKKNLLKEPFNYFVEFAPISEEDEYRRHDDLERLMQSGIVTKKWARGRMSEVDPKAMEREEEKEQLKMMPSYLQIKDQTLAAMAQQAFIEAGISAMPMGGGLTEQERATGNVDANQRRMVPPIREVAPPGSMQDLQNQWKQQRSQTPMSATQGQFGGGNR